MSSSLAHRKAEKKIRFIDSEGNALSNTLVHVKLVNHLFLFGCGAFDSLPATSEADMGQSNVNHDMKMPEKCFFEDRVNKWLEVFNFGTLPFYWGRFEPKEGEILTDSRMRAAKMLQKNHVKVKGHPLCWHTACADWLMDYDNATILQKQLDRIYRDVTAFRGVIDIWDVINEVVIMPVYDRYDNAITRICKELGRVRLVKEVFDAAKSANPDATLLINDFNLSESYRILIDGSLNAGVPITAIGIQTHQHQGYMGREKLEDILERFSVFGLPLHFTENTLISGDLMPKDIVDLNDYQVDEWPSTPEGEERQKKEWSEMYHILFEHPLVEAVTGWDFADGAWLGAPSGLIRKDNTIKPVYHELKRLIHEEWNTEGDLRTDENGNKSFDPSNTTPLKQIWVADGSYVPVEENYKELAFVKTALMTVEQNKIAGIDKEYPHPLKLQEIMKDSALFHATVFPLRNLRSVKGNIYDTVRHVIYDSMRNDEDGQYFETLKWIAYKKWDGQNSSSPSFECPHCDQKVDSGIPFDQDTGICPFCGKEILLTDMVGFHLDMNEDNAPASVASSYMLIMEMLMLFTVIRLQWSNRDPNLISNTLFMKDGPMTLSGQYSKLVPNIREFLNYAKNQGRPIHIIGSEKSGSFFDYLSLCSRFVKPENGRIKYAVLNHGYIRRVIQRAPDRGNPYGLRTNWGEKVFVFLDENTHMVLNMTTGGYEKDDAYPSKDDIIGMERILATLPSLISRKYEGALYPIELVNGIASMSNYPSAKILQDFVEDMIN